MPLWGRAALHLEQHAMRRALARFNELQLCLDLLFFEELLDASSEEQSRIQWTDEEISLLRQRMLQYALHALASTKTCNSTRDEWIEWVEDDHLTPFSFIICAQESGCDPEALKVRVQRLVR